MRKLFTLLLSLLLSSVLTQGFAQRNILVWNSNGSVDVFYSAAVDSITFGAGNELFQLTTSPATGITSEGFTYSGAVQLGEGIKSLAKTPVMGVCYSSVNAEPLVTDDTLALSAGYGDKSASLSGLTSGTTYYYRTYVRLLGEIYYGNVCSVTTNEPADRSKEINGHRFVDLDLPSGILWAETNVGASSAEEAGDYFAWGETDAKSEFSDTNSEWYGKEHTDNLTAEEDAATVNWGTGVRMPTQTEMEELRDKCTWTAATVNNVAGFKIVSKTNGNEIFLPSAGYYKGTDLLKSGTNGYYWCSTPSNEKSAYSLDTFSGKLIVSGYYRYFGRTVRAVAE